MSAAENTNDLPDGLAGQQAPTPEPQAEKPRGRGRPKGSTNKNAEDKPEIESLLDQQAGGSTEQTAKPQQKKRGPKTGKADAAAMAKQLVGVHTLMAMVTGLPELQISEPEAENLAAAVTNVCEEYGLSISGKTGAAIQLAAACAMIYGPRALMINARIQQAKAQAARDVTPPTA